jgi:hypothetical protein
MSDDLSPAQALAIEALLNRIGTLEQRIEVLELRERERFIDHAKWDNHEGKEHRWSEEDFRGKA